MTVDYSPEACERFTKDLVARCSSQELKYLWLIFSSENIPFLTEEEAKGLPFFCSSSLALIFQRNFFALSLWNRQKILFDLADTMQRVGREAAVRVANQARIEEPL